MTESDCLIIRTLSSCSARPDLLVSILTGLPGYSNNLYASLDPLVETGIIARHLPGRDSYRLGAFYGLAMSPTEAEKLLLLC